MNLGEAIAHNARAVNEANSRIATLEAENARLREELIAAKRKADACDLWRAEALASERLRSDPSDGAPRTFLETRSTRIDAGLTRHHQRRHARRKVEMKNASQRPSIGRIVHYTPVSRPDGDDSKAAPYPAIITHVFSDTVVNLHVFSDGSFRLSSAERTPTSVSMGASPGTWQWPPYTPPAGSSDRLSAQGSETPHAASGGPTAGDAAPTDLRHQDPAEGPPKASGDPDDSSSSVS